MSHTPSDTSSARGSGERAHRAGAFDIRNFIAALLALYGVVLLLTGLLGTSQKAIDRAGGININLWAGFGIVVAAGVLLVWARLRPVVVPADPAPADDGPSAH